MKVASKVGQDAVRLVDWAAGKTDDPEVFLRVLVERHQLLEERSDFRRGCAMMGIMANTASQSESLRATVADAIAGWVDAIAQGLNAKGVEPCVAHRAAALIVAGIEGAVLVSRTTRSVAPFSLLAGMSSQLLASDPR